MRPQRVRLIVEPLDDTRIVETGPQPRAAPGGIEGMRFFSRESLPSRDELHDRP